ncbi:MAG: IPT/TIG domain-containing protein [Pyrinomonadaceae bacterium]
MKSPFEGKTRDERNKIIAAGVLGVVALFALYFAFGRGSSSTTATVKVATATPKPGASAAVTRPDTILPTVDEQAFAYETQPINYSPGNAYAPDAGRNIFAFYEPPPPCRGAECPTPRPPTPLPTPLPPTPAPTPPIILTYANPQNVYAGSKGFRIEVVGERFSPEARIYFNQRELKTQFLTAGQLTAEVPADLIAREGPAQVLVQTVDGRFYSNQFIFNVQPPPRPAFQYIGMIGRKRYNNDTAYFLDPAKPTPYGARLNDVVGGRFRLIDISAVEVVFEDVNLGFRHKVPITTAASGANTGTPFMPFNPGNQGDIPGIPMGVPRYVPPPASTPRRNPNTEKKEDVDDLDGDGVRRP